MAKKFEYSDALRKRFADTNAYAKKHLSTREGVTRDGTKYEAPNFGDGIQRKYVDMVIKEMTDIGYTRNDILQIWHKETGVGLNYGKRFLSGTQKGMQVWEFNHFLKTFNFTFDIKFSGAERFTNSIERNRLIIRCLKYPKFHVNFNIDDWKDFELEYKNREEVIEFGVRKMTMVFKQMLEYYFIGKTRKKAYPFRYDTIRKIFQHKYGLMKLKAEEGYNG